MWILFLFMGLFMGFRGIFRLLMYGQVGGSITPITMVYDTYDELVHAIYKLTYNRSYGPQKFWKRMKPFLQLR